LAAEEHAPPQPAPRVLSPQNHYLMTSMMQDVIRRGTATRARSLGRGDLAGKTGTTNDQRDAWFNGFNPSLVGVVWVGFDSYAPLGRGEVGGRAALPAWIEFMKTALDGVPEQSWNLPEGIVTVRIDPETGRKALYVNEHFTRRIVEMNAQESDHLLAYLTKWVQQPAFTVRYHWTAGTIGMWDNRFTQHYVVNDFTGERVIERVTVMGDTVEGNRPRWQPYTETAKLSAMTRHDRQLIRHLNQAQRQAAAE